MPESEPRLLPAKLHFNNIYTTQQILDRISDQNLRSKLSICWRKSVSQCGSSTSHPDPHPGLQHTNFLQKYYKAKWYYAPKPRISFKSIIIRIFYFWMGYIVQIGKQGVHFILSQWPDADLV